MDSSLLHKPPFHWFAVNVLALVVAVTIGTAVGLLSTRPSTAQAACSSAPRTAYAISSQFDGGWNTGFSTTVGGAFAQIQNDQPYVASGSRVTDWVMIANANLGEWSQIGWYYDNTYGTRVFAQVNNNPGVETKFGSASSWGTYPHFTALYNFVVGKFSFQVNGTDWIPDGSSTPYTAAAIWTPHDVEVLAERHNNADQVPGGTSASAGHFDAQIYYSGSWHDGWLTTYNGGISFQGVDPSAGSVAYYNGKQFYIWDTQCAT
jgi:hypothetical protein